ncbi:MAG: molybdate ABC transporter substrate-binding protein [Bacteroidetes bacterium]|nr:MAG: molybdate ABC transporter substrate-binding protein [Bacteroidota bacterium]
MKAGKADGNVYPLVVSNFILRTTLFLVLIQITAPVRVSAAGGQNELRQTASHQKAALRIAVASNFALTARALANDYESQSANRVVIISGSTGKHYAQIINGAPFDIFLAADTLRPALLEEEGFIDTGTRRTYAIGRLVLWSAKSGIVDEEGHILERLDQYRIAVANERLAPYGVAAREVISGAQHWNQMRDSLIRGENISQVYHFVASGGADAGFVALSSVINRGGDAPGAYWIIPQKLYTPIDQQAVILRSSLAAIDFMAYLGSEDAKAIISTSGYRVPQ